MSLDDKFDKVVIIVIIILSLIGTFFSDGIKSAISSCAVCVAYIGYILFNKLCDIEKKIDGINKD